MSLSINLNKLRILEIVSLNLNSIQFAVLVLVLIEFLLLNIFLDRKKISSFFLGFYSLLLSPVSAPTKNQNEPNPDSPSTVQEAKNIDDDDRRSIRRGDVEMVLKSLRISCNGDDIIPGELDAEDIIDMFDAKSASLDEVREAFDVYDEKKDGYIDAEELQKVLCGLGLNEGLEIEKCMRMIGVFDEDGDGKMNFDEFVKLFMENI